jgi:hypothetical protein
MIESPRLALGLLTRFLAGGRRESLIGDLLEEYRSGRSRFWLWRQVIAAIAAGAIAELVDEPLRALSAAAVMLVLTLGWVESTWALYLWLNRLPWVANVDSGWASTRVHTLFFYFMEPFGGGLSVLWCVGVAWAARLSARLNPRAIAGHALASTLVVTPLALWWGVPMLRFVGYNFAVPRIATLNLLVALFVTVGLPVAAAVGATRGEPRHLG